MSNRVFCTLVAVMLFASLQPAFAQRGQNSQHLDELDQKCEAAIDIAMIGIRQQRIAECLLSPPSPGARPPTLEQCERYWVDYGKIPRQRTPLDLPVCQEAFEARRQHSPR